MLGHADGLRTRTLELFDSIGFQHKVLQEAQSLAHYAFWVSLEDPVRIWARDNPD